MKHTYFDLQTFTYKEIINNAKFKKPRNITQNEIKEYLFIAIV